MILFLWVSNFLAKTHYGGDWMYKFFTDAERILNESLENVSGKSHYFYKKKVIQFFCEYMGKPDNQNKPLLEISYLDIQIFLDGLGYKTDTSGYENYYSALNKFFGFAHITYRTGEVMARVRKPERKRKKIEYIDSNNLKKMVCFVMDEEESLKDKVLLGLFLYTGLKRDYIEGLTFKDVDYEKRLILLDGENGIELTVPIIDPLLKLIKLMCDGLESNDHSRRIIMEKGSEINRRLETITKKVCGKQFNPQMFSYTFIKECLDKGLSVLSVSEIVDLLPSTVLKHLYKTDSENVIYQTLTDLYIFE